MVLYGIRWQRCRFGIMAAIFDSIRGRSSSFALSGRGDESPTDSRVNRAMAWLGITPGSRAR